MGEVERYPAGTFCWVDLGTTDVAGAKAFYGGLFGWTFEDVPPGEDAFYTLCRLDGKDVTGLHPHSEAEGSGWTSYVRVDDADAVARKAEAAGGAVVNPPVEVPGTSRVAVIRDPGGVDVALWEPLGFEGARVVNVPGAWTWNELTTPDLTEAARFYGDVFGWRSDEAPGPGGRAAFRLAGYLVGGAHEPAMPEDRPAWTVAFWVADADESAAAVERLGGRVLLPPMDVPVGRFAIAADPTGAAFTITAVPGGPVASVAGS